MTRILVIEDNIDVNNIIKEDLTKEGYVIDSAYDGLEGLKKFKANKYDLILLDIMIPYISGDQVLKEIRSVSMMPVIILSAKDMTGTKIDFLKSGADDYITKPFDLGELSARISTVLRRSNNKNETKNTLEYKDIVIDLDSKKVMVSSNLMELTAKEYLIMELFLKNKERIFSKASIYEKVWKDEYIGDDNAVKTHMSNLRSKLKKLNKDEEYIETVWGLGYRLKK